MLWVENYGIRVSGSAKVTDFQKLNTMLMADDDRFYHLLPCIGCLSPLASLPVRRIAN
jgi:hypothetical protein